MTSAPTITVEIDFSDTPWGSDATTVWIDVSEYVQSITPERGRSNEIGNVDAGTMQIVLDNSDGRFTPALSTSPYYPHVKPRRPIRAFATLEGVQYPLFRGVTGSFPASTAAGVTTLTIGAVDFTTPLSKKKLTNPYIYAATSVNPATGSDFGANLVELWKMNDGPDSFHGLIDPLNNYMIPVPAASNTGVKAAGGTSPTVAQGDSSILPNTAGLGSAQVSGTTVEVVPDMSGSGTTPVTSSGIALVSTPFPLAPSLTGGDFTVSMFFRANDLPAIGSTTDAAHRPDNLMPFKIVDAVTGQPFIEVFQSVGIDYFGYYPHSGAGTLNRESFYNVDINTDPFREDYTKLGRTNLIQVSYSHNAGSGGGQPAIGLWINGIGLWTDILGTDVFRSGQFRLVIGSEIDYLPGPQAIGDSAAMGCDFQVEMVAVHNLAVKPADTSYLQLAAGGLDEAPPSERINYLLDQLNWPDTLRNISTDDGATRMRFINWEGVPDTLAELQAPALDANGLLFVGADGAVTYQTRWDRVNPVPKWIFDENAGTGAEAPLEWQMSEDDITNVAEVDNAFGVKTTLRNESSIAEFGETSVSLSTRLSDDDEAIQGGYWRINRFGDAQLRLDGLTLNPTAHSTGALWLAVCSIELSDCIGLRNLPGNAPDAVTNYFVEKITHNITKDGETLNWTTDLQVSPAINREAWVLGDANLSLLGDTTFLHY